MKTKLYNYHFDFKIASQKLVIVGLAGFMWQSCSKSDIIVQPESISEKISVCKNMNAATLKDSIGRNKGANLDGIAIDSLKNIVVVPQAKRPKNIINNIAEGNALADSVYASVSIPRNINQATDNYNDDTPLVIAPLSPPTNTINKPIVIVAPLPTTNNDNVSPEISVKTSQGAILHPPKNLLIGLSKAYPLAIDTYTGLLSQMPGGENEFWFYGKTNQHPYPNGEWVIQANGYSTIDLPTHAINARAGSDIHHPEYNNVICKIEYTIKDSKGNVVMFCKDTKGGFHPTFIPNERGNNHPKESQRFLPYGIYTVEFKNITQGSINAPIRVTYNRAGGNATMGEYFDAIVDNQKTVTFTIEIFEQREEISMFKLNCNMVP